MEASLKCPFRRLCHRRHHWLTAPDIYLWLHNYVRRGHVSLDCTVQWLNEAKMLVPGRVCLLQDPLLNICFRESPLLWLRLFQSSVGVRSVSQAGLSLLVQGYWPALWSEASPSCSYSLSLYLFRQFFHSHTDICSVQSILILTYAQKIHSYQCPKALYGNS